MYRTNSILYTVYIFSTARQVLCSFYNVCLPSDVRFRCVFVSGTWNESESVPPHKIDVVVLPFFAGRYPPRGIFRVQHTLPPSLRLYRLLVLDNDKYTKHKLHALSVNTYTHRKSDINNQTKRVLVLGCIVRWCCDIFYGTELIRALPRT